MVAGAVLPHVAGTMTVTNRELFFKTEDEYREVAGILRAHHKHRPENRAITAINAKASGGVSEGVNNNIAMPYRSCLSSTSLKHEIQISHGNLM